MNASHKLKPCFRDAFVILAIVLIGIGAAVASHAMARVSDEVSVVITENGREVFRQDLSRVKDRLEWSPDGSSYPITVCMTPDGVHVETSDCPGGDCVRMGTITRAGESIVCLPNQLMIFLEGTNPVMDAVTG